MKNSKIVLIITAIYLANLAWINKTNLLLDVAMSSEGFSIKTYIIMFSGFEDPNWDFTSMDDLFVLNQFLVGLPKRDAPDPTKWPGLLGRQRGFLLIPEGDVPNFPSWVRVFQGVIEIKSDTGVEYFVDSKGLEAYLTEEASRRELKWPN